MKKIYLMGLSAMFALAVNAQTTVKIKKSESGRKNQALMVSKNGNTASPLQITGGITCATQYVAGTTMDLVFTVLLTNTDSEYGDKITLTFPTGVTPNTNASNTPSIGSGATANIEQLNGVVGQTISWGDNDNSFGGIVPATSYSLQVNVTIGAGVTGNQMVSYDVSGDTYGAGPGDLVGGMCTVFPAGATVVDVKTTLNGVFLSPTSVAALNNCSMATHTVAAQITNLGTTSEVNVPINYSINGVASTLGAYPGPLNPGDTVLVAFPMTYDFSAAGAYVVKTWSEVAGDAVKGNDTVSTTINNSLPIALTSTTYMNGIEAPADFSSLTQVFQNSGLNFGISGGTFHSGAQALFYTLAGGNPAGTYDTKVIMPCMDVTSGDTYRISYWKKANTSGTLTVNGMSGIFTGTANTYTGTATVLKAYYAITPNAQTGVWAKDSVDFVASATETRYFAIGGKVTIAGAATQGNVRLDDIKIEKIITIGIKTNVALEAVSIFPNPTTGVLNITTIDATTSVEIFNVIGEKVYANKNLTKGNNAIDLSSLSNGSYFVKMNSNNNVTTKKVILSK